MTIKIPKPEDRGPAKAMAVSLYAHQYAMLKELGGARWLQPMIERAYVHKTQTRRKAQTPKGK